MTPVGVVVLAAGGSSRLGRSKLLIDLPNGKTLIRHVLEIVLQTSFRPVIVVLGRDAEIVKKQIQHLPCSLVVNPNWQEGMSASLKLGVGSLPVDCSASLVVLADQPFQTTELMEKLVDAWRDTAAQIIYPSVGGQRSNPVVLDRATFASIRELEGDTGARKLFSQFTTAPVAWPDERLLIDIDQEGDVQRVQDLMASTSSGTTTAA